MSLQPLDWMRSIKAKLGLLIVGSIVVSVTVVIYGWRTGIRPRFLILVTGVIVLALIQFLAHGMTKPLREMAAATSKMAGGDYRVRVTASSRDEVGELARAFNSMAAELGAVDAQRRALIANVSHELRTPLAGVQARLENMLDGIEPADTATLERALRSVERLGRLVEQLLDLSRLEAGGVPLQHDRIAVRELLDAVSDEAQPAAAAVTIRVEVAGEPMVDADADRLHQVLANLVENAVRHSPPSGAVTLGAERLAAAVRLTVTDDGPGIPAAAVTTVFERFTQVDGRERGGAGLGLAIARGIVELHGGTIRAEPVQPTGCRMVVELPVLPGGAR